MDSQFERKKSEEQKTLFGVESSSGKDEWLTPPEIVSSLGAFDLDPYSPIARPWPTAINHYTINDDGLKKDWVGRVWCNPPYGDRAKFWLRKCSVHGNAIALIFARTETKMFFEDIWPIAHAVFFFKGRLKFYHVNGRQGGTAGAPSCLIIYGSENIEKVKESGLEGKLIIL